jgi:hypothetical protein
MADIRNYQVDEAFDLPAFAESLRDFIASQFKLETQVLGGDGSYVIQSRETKAWKKYSGMDLATTIKAELGHGLLTVELGQGKWMDKAAGAAVGWFLFWPALVPAAIGAFQQARLPKTIFDYIDRYLAGSGNGRQGSSEPNIRCTGCSASIPFGVAFCPQCGHKMSEECPVCHAVLAVSDVFCRNCGTRRKDPT